MLAAETGGTIKLMTVGEDSATERLRALIRRVLQKGRVPADSISATAMGLAGSSSSSVREWAERVLHEEVSGTVRVRGDEEIALDAAFQGGPGILVIAGTGSNAVGRGAQGALVRAGGWGPMIGDEGSGNWIGNEALRMGLHAHDRQVDTCLLREIQHFWHLRDLGELVAFANRRPRPHFAELTTVVARCAENGDGLALSVLERAGEELAAIVSLVASKMAAAGCTAEDSQHVAFTGSVLGKIRAVRRSFVEHLRVSLPHAQVREDEVDALEGALWQARRGA